MWPVTLFQGSTELDGDSPQSFASTYQKMLAEHKNHDGVYKFHQAFGKYALYFYAKHSPDFTTKEYNEVLSYGRIPEDFVKAAFTTPSIIEDLRDELDGMDISDVIESADDAVEDLEEMLRDRKPDYQSVASVQESDSIKHGQGCVDSKVYVYRSDAGEDSLITADMLSEWEEQCAASLQ
ncbi:hypothetical protein [Geopseudomonas aromaticivorans]